MTDALAAEAAEIAALEKQAGTPPVQTEQVSEPQTETAESEPKEPEREGEHEPDETVEIENKGRFVRQGEYRSAVDRYKSAEARAKEIEAKYASDMAEVTRRLALIAEARQESAQKQQAPEVEIPDKNLDPIGHFETKIEGLERKLAEAEKWRGEQQKVSEEDVKRQKIGAEVTRLEAEFAKAVPDYPQAQEFLQKHWAGQATFFGVTPAQAVQFYATQIVQAAARQGKNPAEIAYEFAKSAGYQKPNGNGNGTHKTGPNLDTIAKGVAVSKSTSVAPGNPVPGQLTAEALLKMDEDEFAAKFGARESKEWDRTMRRLMGA